MVVTRIVIECISLAIKILVMRTSKMTKNLVLTACLNRIDQCILKIWWVFSSVVFSFIKIQTFEQQQHSILVQLISN